MSRFAILAALLLLVSGATAAVAARTADECRGLLVCLPVEGPWVALPAGKPRAEWDLRCPRRNYIVAGTDVRLADRWIDVSIRGETGSPVSPGVTTGRSVLFVGSYVGPRRRSTSFRPYAGCIPTSGGGGRNQTSHSQAGALRPTRPLERRVAARRLRSGSTTLTVRCPQGGRLVGSSHALGFHTDAPPSAAAIGAVRVGRDVRNGQVVATARLTAAAPAGRVELQVHALCVRGRG